MEYAEKLLVKYFQKIVQNSYDQLTDAQFSPFSQPHNQEILELMETDDIRISRYFTREMIHFQLGETCDLVYDKLMFEPLGSGNVATYFELIKQENNSEKRDSIEKQKNDILKKHELNVYSLFKQYNEKCIYYFGGNYIDLYEKIYDFQYDAYLVHAESILTETEKEYQKLLLHLREKSSQMIALHSKTDLLYLIQLLKDRTQLENDIGIAKITDNFYHIFNIENNIKVEYFEHCVNPQILACTIPINIPNNIKILFFHTKHTDNRIKFHELGHAISFACVNKRQKMSDKYIYNEIMQEAYAYLFEALLSQKFNLNQDDKINRFLSLYEIRLHAAKYIYQFYMYTSTSLNLLKAKFTHIMSNALKVSIVPSMFVMDSYFELPVAQNFIGHVIAEEAEKILLNHYGKQWFNEPEVYQKLKRMFEKGAAVTTNNYKEFL